jgi:hypothetical protein
VIACRLNQYCPDYWGIIQCLQKLQFSAHPPENNTVSLIALAKKDCSSIAVFFHQLSGTARGVWNILTSNPDVESPATASRNPAAVDQRTIINAFKRTDKYYFLGGEHQLGKSSRYIK